MEQLSENANRMGNVVKRGSPGKAIGCLGAGGEKAIGDGLGIQVGKLFRRQSADEVSLERLIEPQELTFACGCLLGQLLEDNVPQKPGTLGEFHSQALSGKGPGQGEAEKLVQEIPYGVGILQGRGLFQRR